jgi:ElaB/YqjD/DUF883 family membrane-anchored ribosome-binding protein
MTHSTLTNGHSAGHVVARSRKARLTEAIETWIAHRPATYLASCVAVGAVLGWLIKRR